MKFTTIEPLNQRFNEALKKRGLTKIADTSTSSDLINHIIGNLGNDRVFDEVNETTSQIVFTTTDDGNLQAFVLISNSDIPEYEKVFTVI